MYSISPRNTATSWPVTPSHKRMSFSWSPWDAIRLPSGLTAKWTNLMFVASQHGDPPARRSRPTGKLGDPGR